MAMSKDEPIVGRCYSLEDASNGTQAQGRAFHALLGLYYSSRAWSYEGSGYNLGATYDEFRNMIKRKLGAGFVSYIYVAGDPPTIHDAKELSDIPPGTPRSLIRGRLKSWGDYTKKERMTTMDKLIAEMHETGVNSPRFQEILEGMAGLWK
jgi:hypothetical protein